MSAPGDGVPTDGGDAAGMSAPLEVERILEHLPPPLRGAARQMLVGLSETPVSRARTLTEAAEVIASASFRPVLEREARLNALDLAKRVD